MSQIIIYVDNCALLEEVCAFCTKSAEKHAQIWFTYYCFPEKNIKINDFEKKFCNDAKTANDNVLLISNNANICKYAKELDIACAGLIADEQSGDDFSGILYWISDIENMSIDTLDRIWKRSRKIPWTIAITEDLIIREQTVDDVSRLYEIYSDEDIKKNVDGLKENVDDEIEYMRDYINHQYRFCEYGIWALVDRHTNELIGRAGLEMRDGVDGFEIGYVIDKKYRRKGYAKQAVEAIIEYAVDEYDVEELHVFTKKDNLPSVKLLEKLNFHKVGTLHIDGCEYDKYQIRF